MLSLFFGIWLLGMGACSEVNPDADPTVTQLPQSTLFRGPQPSGEVEADIIDEASGLAASRSNDFYLWTHNDSGGDPALYLMTNIGSDSGRYVLEGAQNVDWEDMAIGPGPDAALTYLLVGDIGDNLAQRNDYTIYRVPEPDLNIIDLPEEETLMGVETINFVYSDELSRDAETLMVDPLTRDIYIISKREAQVGVYRLPFPQELAETDTAEFQGIIPFSNIVAGDISPDGTEILIKDYFFVYHWSLAQGMTLQQQLRMPPNRLEYTAEPQGEAIAWAADAARYFTLSEEDSEEPATLFNYQRN